METCEAWFYISSKKCECSLPLFHEDPHQMQFETDDVGIEGTMITVTWPRLKPQPEATMIVQLFCTNGVGCRCGADHRITKR